MFRAPLCSSSGKSIVLIRHLVYVTVCRWPSSSIQTYIHLHTVAYTRCRINTIDSPDDEHRVAGNMQRVGINISEKRTVRQVGYLQEQSRDARSTEHKNCEPALSQSGRCVDQNLSCVLQSVSFLLSSS